jgi:soluble lytic murein transglycosylase-like protein
MSTVAATILALCIVWQGKVTVYVRHLRLHPLGAEERAEELAQQHIDAAWEAGVDVALLLATNHDESGFNHDAISEEGALGASQLLPTSRWGRGWLLELESLKELGVDAREQLNITWGAYALRDALEACGGNEVRALGFYRTGKCVDGPRGRRTVRLAKWIRARLQAPHGKAAAWQSVASRSAIRH